jgi:putative Mn2+ efflux pump MntP
VFIGKKFGTAISGKAGIFGGIILIIIGVQIFVKGVF